MSREEEEEEAGGLFPMPFPNCHVVVLWGRQRVRMLGKHVDKAVTGCT